MIIILFFFVLTLTYSLVVPTYESPDEGAHLAYALFLQQHAALPNLNDMSPAANPCISYPCEAWEPPLYYAILGGVASLYGIREMVPFTPNPNGQGIFLYLHGRSDVFPFLDGPLQIHFLRLTSIPFGIGTIVITYELAVLIGASRKTALLAAALNSLIPQFAFISGMINNDPVSIFLCSLGIYFATRILIGRSSNVTLDGVYLGLAIGLATITKVIVAPLAAIILFSLLLKTIRDHSLLRTTAAFTMLTAAIGGWWYARNLLLYKDISGGFAATNSLTPNLTYANFFGTMPRTYYFLNYDIPTFTNTFFGILGARFVPLNPTFYLILETIFGAALLSAVGYVFESSQKRTRWVFIFLLAIPLGLLVLHIATSYFSPQPQGRQLFPGIGPICALAAIGLNRILPLKNKATAGIQAIILLLMIAANAYLIFTYATAI